MLEVGCEHGPGGASDPGLTFVGMMAIIVWDAYCTLPCKVLDMIFIFVS